MKEENGGAQVESKEKRNKQNQGNKKKREETRKRTQRRAPVSSLSCQSIVVPPEPGGPVGAHRPDHVRRGYPVAMRNLDGLHVWHTRDHAGKVGAGCARLPRRSVQLAVCRSNDNPEGIDQPHTRQGHGAMSAYSEREPPFTHLVRLCSPNSAGRIESNQRSGKLVP